MMEDQDQISSFSLSPNSRFRVLGVCGGIGSGKSEACRLLVSELKCAALIDADKVAHRVYRPGSDAIQDVARAFGADQVLTDTGEIDRKKLAALVFGQPDAMKQLERIVWPHVQRDVQAQVEQVRAEYYENLKKQKEDSSSLLPVVVVEAAMLLDAGWQDAFLDSVWVVQVPSETAQERLVNHRGMTAEDAAQRLHAQLSRRGIGNLQQEVENKVVRAVIQNTGTLEELKLALSQRLFDPSAWYPIDEEDDDDKAEQEVASGY